MKFQKYQMAKSKAKINGKTVIFLNLELEFTHVKKDGLNLVL